MDKQIAELLAKYKKGDLTEDQFSAELKKILPTEWVPKNVFNEESEKRKQAEKQAKESGDQLNTLKEKANLSDEYKKQIADLEAAQKADKENFDKQLKETKQGYALDSALTAAKAKNPKAVKALLDPSKLVYGDDGNITGLKEQLEALQKSDAYLFDSADNTDPAPNPIFPMFGNPSGKPAGNGNPETGFLDAMAAAAGVKLGDK